MEQSNGKTSNSWSCTILSSLLLGAYLFLAFDRWEDKSALLIGKAILYMCLSWGLDRYGNQFELNPAGRAQRMLTVVVWVIIGFVIFGNPNEADYHGEPKY